MESVVLGFYFCVFFTSVLKLYRKKKSKSNSYPFEVHIHVFNFYAHFCLHTHQVLSGSEWGNMLLWEASLIKVELCRSGMKPCHQGPINQIMLDEGEIITAGADGCVRVRQQRSTEDLLIT